MNIGAAVVVMAIVVIVTVLAIETDIPLSGIGPGIECNEVVAR